MKYSDVTYVGSFPPPYGGVTVKNALLCKHLSKRLKVEKLDLTHAKSLDFHVISRLLRAVLSRNGSLVLGISGEWRFRLTCILYYFNRTKMRRSLLVVMGGDTPKDVAYVKRMNEYRRVYVETEGMKQSFERMGANNVAIYPNCRERHVEHSEAN